MTRAEWSPLPASLAPRGARCGALPPSGRLAEWAVEMKWDGVRALAFIEDGVLRLVSRTGKDISRHVPRDLAVLGAGRCRRAGAARRRDRRVHRRRARLRGAAAADARVVGRRGASASRPRSPSATWRSTRCNWSGVRLTRAAVLSTQGNPQDHHGERSRLAHPARFPRTRPGRGPRPRRSPTGSRGWSSSGSTRCTSRAPGRGAGSRSRTCCGRRSWWRAGSRARATGPGWSARCWWGCTPISGALLYAGHVGHRVLRFGAADAHRAAGRRCGGRTRRSTARCRPSMQGPRYG